MVLSRRLDTIKSQAGSSAGMFDGLEPSDVTNVFFFLECSVMRCERKEDATILLTRHLDGRAYDFFYDTFAKDG